MLLVVVVVVQVVVVVVVVVVVGLPNRATESFIEPLGIVTFTNLKPQTVTRACYQLTAQHKGVAISTDML